MGVEIGVTMIQSCKSLCLGRAASPGRAATQRQEGPSYVSLHEDKRLECEFPSQPTPLPQFSRGLTQCLQTWGQ